MGTNSRFKKITSVLLLSLFIGQFSPPKIYSAVFSVGEKFQLKNIRQALLLANPHDTITVYGGKYQEGNLVIQKPITLIGINNPIIDGEKKHEVISIKADSVTITGFIIQQSSHAILEDPAGIKIYNRRNIAIIGNRIEDTYFGVYVQNGSHCIIKNNTLIGKAAEEYQSGNGIHCWKSDSLQIIGNSIQGHRDGIYFEFVTASIIWRNISKHNLRYGLHFMFSDNDAYISNVFKHNGAGVAVMFTKKVVMLNNHYQDNWGDSAYGILLKEISDAYMMGNNFYANTSAIFMEGTNRIIIERNNFKDNGWGIKIQASCMDNVVRYNNFINNTFDVSTNGNLVLNTFEKNYWDKYEGYDLDKDSIGDVPYHPLSLFSVIAEKNPTVMLLYRSFMVMLLDKSEKIIPSLTPENFVDNSPVIKKWKL